MAFVPIEDKRLNEIVRQEIERLRAMGVISFDRDDARQVALLAVWQSNADTYSLIRIVARRAINKEFVQKSLAKKRGGKGEIYGRTRVEQTAIIHVPVMIPAQSKEGAEEEIPNPELVTDPWEAIEVDIALDQLVKRVRKQRMRGQGAGNGDKVDVDSMLFELKSGQTLTTKQRTSERRMRFMWRVRRLPRRRHD